MKICLIGPGILPIPPTGWGGCEILMWNLKCELEAQGHEVLIINTKNLREAINSANAWSPDFVHLHYDEYADIMPYISSPGAMTSHYPYLDYPSKRSGYEWIFQKFSQNHSFIFSLSDRNSQHFKDKGTNPELVWEWMYGVPSAGFRFTDSPAKKAKSICLGKIEPRKFQSFLQGIEGIDFAGPIADNTFKESSNYQGIWNRDQVYNNLTDYANLVLFSDGEAAPQVVPEALISGCGLVLSEEAAANLDLDLPFIDVVKTSCSSDDLGIIIKNNRIKSLSMRSEIREYGLSKFGMTNCTKLYTEKIEEIIANAE